MVSSVSPERCEHMTPQPLCLHILTASIDSVMVPIWLTFSSNALHALSSIAFLTRVTFVTVRSSPTIWVGSPIDAVIPAHAAQSS